MRSHTANRVFRSYWLFLLVGLAVAALLGGLAGLWAYDHDSRVRFHVQETWASLRGLVVPQPEVVPTPVRLASAPTFAPSPTATLPPTATPGPTTSRGPSASPTVLASPTPAPPSPTPLPRQVTLTGFKHEYQLYNNCGPASLAIDLSYWGWTGGQKTAAAVLKPNQDDKNVSPRELYEYALTQGFDAYIRVNGDVDTIKRFLAAGFPVLVEKGFTCAKGERCSGWFGHYSVVSGYDDGAGVFTLQDSFRGPNIKMAYADLMENWRAFDFLYVIFFPAGEANDARVRALLGPAVDLNQNYHDALAAAQADTNRTTGEAAAFAWFNVGTELHNLQDYGGAAAAYDQSRQIGLPYRMLWYQFGPYRSYYYMARYQDVVDLASFAIDSVNTVPGLEEAYYWRGLAEIALGQPDKSEADFRTALERHPNWQPAIDALGEMGLAP